MIDDFQLMYGNDDKMDYAAKRAKYLFSTREPVTYAVISEVEPGSCELNGEATCTARGTYFCNADNAYSFTWTISAGSIISGEGTNTIVVETTSGSNTVIEIGCIAHGRINSFAANNVTFVHSRT
jgi:hypothetical protein